jgi:uncharacterized protein YggU (UPF0235/DUF167 family)
MEYRVQVKAGARNDRIERTGNTFAVSVRAKAAGGMANASVIALIARELGIPPKKLRIVRGLRGAAKTVETQA